MTETVVFATLNSSQVNGSKLEEVGDTTCWSMLEPCWCNAVYVISAFAIVGNLVTLMIILNSPKLRQRPTFIFLSFLAAADFGVMVELSTFCIVDKPIKNSIQEEQCVFYNIANWINDSTLYLSFGFILLVTVQRFTIVYFPFCGPKFFSHKRSIHISVLTVVIIFLCNLYVCWIKTTDTDRLKCNDNSLMFNIRMYTFFAITSATWIIMLMLCIAIMHRLHRHHINHNILLRSGHQSRGSRATLDHYNRTHIMLMTNVVAFIVLQGPVFIIDFLEIVSTFSLAIPDTIREVIFLISKLNHCVNFLLYVLTCKEFRSEITKFSVECKHKRQKNKTKESYCDTAVNLPSKRAMKELQNFKSTVANV